MSAAQAAVRGIHALIELQREVSCLQDLHRNSVTVTGNSGGGRLNREVSSIFPALTTPLRRMAGSPLPA